MTVTTFGPGVCYDVPQSRMAEQFAFLKNGLSDTAFVKYMDLVQDEVATYFTKTWGDEGQADLLNSLSNVFTLTSSRCLLGQEIRNRCPCRASFLTGRLGLPPSHPPSPYPIPPVHPPCPALSQQTRPHHPSLVALAQLSRRLPPLVVLVLHPRQLLVALAPLLPLAVLARSVHLFPIYAEESSAQTYPSPT